MEGMLSSWTMTAAVVTLLRAAALTSGGDASGAAITSSGGQSQQLLRNLCANSVIADACRRFIAGQSVRRDCHGQLLGILCSVRTLHCAGHSPTTPTSLENPVCQQSCLRAFRRCASSKLSIFAYVSINEQLCGTLPDQLCHAWREPGAGIQRDDRSVNDRSDGSAGICQSVESAACNQVVFVGDIAGRLRRGAEGKQLRYPFKKSDFLRGNFTYAAEVKLAKAEWLQASAAAKHVRASRRPKSHRLPSLRRRRRRGDRGATAAAAAVEPGAPPPQPVQQPHRGGFEKVLHLEIMHVLYTESGSDSGHILDPGSVQIVRLAPGCGCAPVKLDQTLIFVGYNSYLENVWKRVTLLPSNGHYACKIKRCWLRRGIQAPGTSARRGAAPDCECPCGKSERRRCQQRRRLHSKRRRGTPAVTRTLYRSSGSGPREKRPR